MFHKNNWYCFLFPLKSRKPFPLSSVEEEITKDSLCPTKEWDCHPFPNFTFTYFLVFAAVLPRVLQLCLWTWMSLLNPTRSLPSGFCGMWSSVGGQPGSSQQPMEGRYCQPSPSAACNEPLFSFILLLVYLSSEGERIHPWLWPSSTLVTSCVHLHINQTLAKFVLKAVAVLKALA